MKFLYIVLTAVILGLGCNPSTQPQKSNLPIMGFSTTGPVIPSSWTVATWYVDPANSSGTASDSNNCQTSTTPCLTWQEINVHRWGCLGNPSACPRLRQTTTITFLSSQSGATDPVYFAPAIENAAVVSIQGNLGAGQQIATGTLATTTAKNRGTPQLLQTNSGATAVNQLIANSTHASRAWTYKSLGAGVFSITQPLVAATVPGTSTLSEVDTWANTDSVTVFAPVQVNINLLAPVFADLNGGGTNGFLYIYNINVFDPSGSGFDSLNVMGPVAFYECVIGKNFSVGGSSALNIVHWNSSFVGFGVQGGLSNARTTYVGGQISVGVLQNSFLDGDIIVTQNTTSSSPLVNQSGMALTYIETGKTVTAQSPAFNGTPDLYGSAIYWGPGSINASGSTRFVYPSGAGAAVAAFKQTGTLKLNSGTTACIANSAAATSFGTCNITVSATNLDGNLGATSGCMAVGGGAAFCNSSL